MSEPIRDLETAVRELGALPMPVGPEPQEPGTFRFTLDIEGATDREDASWAAEQAVSAVEGQGYKAFTAVVDESAHYRSAFEAQRSRAETLDRLLRTAQDRVAELEARLATARTEAIADVGDWLDEHGEKGAAHLVYTCDIPAARDMKRADEDRPGMRHAVRTEDDDPARCLKVHPFSPRDGWRMVCGNCDHGKDASCHRDGDR